MIKNLDEILLEIEDELEDVNNKKENDEIIKRVCDGDLANSAYGRKIRSLTINDVV